MKKNSTEIEIPFGAKDSELYQFTYTIPDGYSAEIKDGKVIVKKKESEDERIRKKCIEFIRRVIPDGGNQSSESKEILNCIAYLEKQKEQPMELLEPDKNVEKIIEDVIRVYEKTQGEWVGGYDIDTLIVNLRRAFEQKEQKPLSTEETELNSIAFLELLGYTCIPPGAEQKPVTKDGQQECPYKDLALVKDFFGKYKRKCKLSNKACDSKECEQWNELQAEFKRINEAFENGKNEVINRPEAFGLQKSAEWSDSVAKEMFIKALERAVEQTKKGYELTDCDKHSWWEDFKAYSEIKSAK